MIAPTRATVGSTATASGIGVRCGAEVALSVAPAEIGAGLTIARSDLGMSWPLDLRHSSAGPGCSISADGNAVVAFVEHLMAALCARGVTDCAVAVNGPEIPLFDGSCLALLALLDEAGVCHSAEPVEPIVVAEPAMVIDGESALCALPGEPTEFAYSLAYEHPMIGREFAQFRPDRDDFERDLAPARTFITFEEAEAARDVGLLASGSEENCLVVYRDHLSEHPTLPAALARHKLIDLIGDLYLLGRPVTGRIFAFYTGHRHNHELAAMIAAAQ